MERELHVYLDLASRPVLVGRLWVRVKSGRETASFSYDDSWLGRRGAFALAPSLMLARGQFHSPRPLFNAFSDSAPDSWGRRLMRRSERGRATRAGSQPRTLLEIDYLAGVDDVQRMGGLRYKVPAADAFLSHAENPIPPLIDLPRLLSASDRFERGRATDEDMRIVLAPGSSLGGARPKASVRGQEGHLLIAKFPKGDDDWPVTRWEAATLALARNAGIDAAVGQLRIVARKPVVLTTRFDRQGIDVRIPYMSGLTALDAAENDHDRSYLELVEVLRRDGGSPDQDVRQLWRRMVFNVLVSNTDDHLRNHGFLRAIDGWRLSPAFDLNPCPVDVSPRFHKLALNEIDHAASLETAFSIAPQFGLSLNQATTIAGEVGAAVAAWKEVAEKHGINQAQIDRMASAFEHEDLTQALARRRTATPPAVSAAKQAKNGVRGSKRSPTRPKQLSRRRG